MHNKHIILTFVWRKLKKLNSIPHIWCTIWKHRRVQCSVVFMVIRAYVQFQIASVCSRVPKLCAENWEENVLAPTNNRENMVLLVKWRFNLLEICTFVFRLCCFGFYEWRIGLYGRDQHSRSHSFLISKEKDFYKSLTLELNFKKARILWLFSSSRAPQREGAYDDR